MAEPTTHALKQLASGIYLEGLAVDHEPAVTSMASGAMIARNSFLYRGRSRTPGLRISLVRFDLA